MRKSVWASQKRAGICWEPDFRFLLICCWLFACSSAVAELRVMTLNAEWLWTPYDGRVDGKKYNQGDPLPADYEQEIAFYRQLIHQHQVDLLAISEIENESVAQDLVRHLEGKWSVAFMEGRDTATGQDVAILSRLPLIDGSIQDFGFPGATVPGLNKAKRLSKVVGARYRLSDKYLSVITAHVLSRRNDSRIKSLRRHAQLRALARLADDEASANVAVLVLGDLNDVLVSPGLKTMMNEGRLTSVYAACTDVKISSELAYKTIDHILFRGLRCRSVRQIDLAHHSDHPGVLAVFE